MSFPPTAPSDDIRKQPRVCSSICQAPPLWSCSIRRPVPPLDSGTHLINGRDYSSHDQLAPARHQRLWCPCRGLFLLCLPCRPLTVRGQRPPIDSVPYDWRCCCVTSHCIVHPHKAVSQRIVKGRGVSLCLPPRGDLFLILHVVLQKLCWVCFCCFIHTEVCTHGPCDLILPALAGTMSTGFPYFPSMHKITFCKRHRCVFQQQQQRFLIYSRSYWVNLELQGCQGTVNRMCFPQQLLSWTRSSTQHLCWAPSDESPAVCQASQPACLCSFTKE